MKKIVLGLLALSISLAACAQRGYTLGVRAGLNVANLRISEGLSARSLDMRASFHAGIACQLPLAQFLPLCFETGFYLSGRGGSLAQRDLFLEGTKKLRLDMLYLQVPALVGWHFHFRDFSIQPAAGVYYGLGIHGMLKAAGGKYDLFASTEEDDAVFRRSDFGLRFGLGVAVRRFFVGAGYDLGLLDLGCGTESRISNRSFYISLGYNF